MSESGVSPNEFRGILDEYPNISVIRGEYGELHVAQLNPLAQGGSDYAMRV